MAKPEQKGAAGKSGKGKKFKKRERKNVPFGEIGRASCRERV